MTDLYPSVEAEVLTPPTTIQFSGLVVTYTVEMTRTWVARDLKILQVSLKSDLLVTNGRDLLVTNTQTRW